MTYTASYRVFILFSACEAHARVRELAKAGIKPFIAFTAGEIVNVILG
jgi:hypothetical protein